MSKIKKVALISGITGQDGSFLAEFLIEKGSSGQSSLWGYDRFQFFDPYYPAGTTG